MTGCQGNNAPSVEANPAQSEPALPLTQSNNKENENEQNEKQLNLYEELITDIIFVEYPVIAIVKDQDIRYPEWSQNEPPDEILHQFKVTLVESLKGDLPHSFTYYMILEDEPSTKAEVPYIVALCRVGDTFLAEPLVSLRILDQKPVLLILNFRTDLDARGEATNFVPSIRRRKT